MGPLVIGDYVPGMGRIDDIYESVYGHLVYKIRGVWHDPPVLAQALADDVTSRKRIEVKSVWERLRSA
jgi:hypothetical protein